MPLAQGQILQNRYRIAKLIGQGGFGAVYRAWDIAVNQPCAVKENLDASPEARRQFQWEASVLAGLRHPNLPRVTDHFFISGQGQYLVMDFVEGEDLAQLLDRQGGPLPEARVLPWFEQVCEALEYLHNQQPPIIHRDLKPDNIKITPPRISGRRFCAWFCPVCNHYFLSKSGRGPEEFVMNGGNSKFRARPDRFLTVSSTSWNHCRLN